jgi:hypothetical protein
MMKFQPVEKSTESMERGKENVGAGRVEAFYAQKI